MDCQADKKDRRSIRIRGYDYAEVGPYFITLCTLNRMHLFGKIKADLMILNEVGQIVEQEWLSTPKLRPYVQSIDFVMMPNHFHAIVALMDAECRGTARRAPTFSANAFGNPLPGTLSTVIGAFKSAVTKRFNRLHGSNGASVWQRNYYEHIIRNEESLNRIREYIHYNPLKWSLDRENPERTGEDEFDRWMDSFDTQSGRGMARHAPTPEKGALP